MSPTCFVGVDLGTSGCRAIAIGANKEILARASAPLLPSRRTPEGISEQDAGHWWSTVTSVLRKLTSSLSGRTPAAIAVDGTSATLLLADEQGRPLFPALLYDDRRAVDQASRLTSVAARESAVHSPTSSLAKLLWLMEHRNPRMACHALHQGEWITAKLSGRFNLGDENNCLKLGYDPVKRSWPEWLRKLGIPSSLLPQVVPAGTAVGQVHSTAAQATGLPESCLVIAGTTDSTAATLAAGIREPGQAVTSLGSTLVTKILTDQPLFSAEYGIYSHRIFDLWLAGGASNSGGRVLRKFFDDEEIADLSRLINPHRAICLDYYPLAEKGERFPINDAQMQPRLSPVPQESARFLQGLLEGIARIERLAYRRLGEMGGYSPSLVFTSGRGAENECWQTIRQRILRTPVKRARQTEAAHGTAQLALRGYAGA